MVFEARHLDSQQRHSRFAVVVAAKAALAAGVGTEFFIPFSTSAVCN